MTGLYGRLLKRHSRVMPCTGMVAVRMPHHTTVLTSVWKTAAHEPTHSNAAVPFCHTNHACILENSTKVCKGTGRSSGKAPENPLHWTQLLQNCFTTDMVGQHPGSPLQPPPVCPLRSTKLDDMKLSLNCCIYAPVLSGLIVLTFSPTIAKVLPFLGQSRLIVLTFSPTIAKVLTFGPGSMSNLLHACGCLDISCSLPPAQNQPPPGTLYPKARLTVTDYTPIFTGRQTTSHIVTDFC